MLVNLIALLMFVAGVAVTFSFQLQAGARPTFDVRKWKPIWKNPSYNRRPAFWLGVFLWLAGAGLIAFGH